MVPRLLRHQSRRQTRHSVVPDRDLVPTHHQIRGTNVHDRQPRRHRHQFLRVVRQTNSLYRRSSHHGVGHREPRQPRFLHLQVSTLRSPRSTTLNLNVLQFRLRVVLPDPQRLTRKVSKPCCRERPGRQVTQRPQFLFQQLRRNDTLPFVLVRVNGRERLAVVFDAVATDDNPFSDHPLHARRGQAHHLAVGNGLHHLVVGVLDNRSLAGTAGLATTFGLDVPDVAVLVHLKGAAGRRTVVDRDVVPTVTVRYRCHPQRRRIVAVEQRRTLVCFVVRQLAAERVRQVPREPCPSNVLVVQRASDAKPFATNLVPPPLVHVEQR